MPNGSDSKGWFSRSDYSACFDKLSKNKTGESAIDFQGFKDLLDDVLYRSKAQDSGSVQRLEPEEELKLFKLFDLNDDDKIDAQEFKPMCDDWLDTIRPPSSALIIVDVQNDFIDGSLALINGPAEQDGAEVVDVINRVIETWPIDIIVYTQDWHPLDHIGFHDNLHLRKYRLKGNSSTTTGANHEGVSEPHSKHPNGSIDQSYKFSRLVHEAKLFDTVLFEDGKMEQKLWPIHCVQNSWGAELHPRLKVVPNAIRILKGTLSNVDAYSAFWDNMRLKETGLRQELMLKKIEDVFVCGLALDYCVAASAMDSVRAGFKTFVIEDACRGIDEDEIQQKRMEMLQNGIKLIDSTKFDPHAFKVSQAIEKTRAFIARGAKK